MTKAPISQTIILTEDGSSIPVTIANAVTIPPPVLPEFLTLPTIDKAEPRLGDLLTGIDPTFANGSIVSRRWLSAGVQIATGLTCLTDRTGVYVFEVVIEGNGITAKAAASVIVLAPLPTLLSVNAGSTTVQAADIVGFAARYAEQRDWLAEHGIAIAGSLTGTPSTAFAAIQAALRQARATAAGPANTLTYQGQALTYQGQPLTYGASA